MVSIFMHSALALLAQVLRADPGSAPLVTLWIDADDAVLAAIARVTYHLPEGYNPSVIPRFSPDDGFALTFILAEGETVVFATAHFTEGDTLEFSVTIAPR